MQQTAYLHNERKVLLYLEGGKTFSLIKLMKQEEHKTKKPAI